MPTQETVALPAADYEHSGKGNDLVYGHCPECHQLIVNLRWGTCEHESEQYGSFYLSDVESETIVYPKTATRSVEPEVPEDYANDFVEAFTVLQFSPKASAALSRRILQQVLREIFQIKPSSLAKEIDDFLEKETVPDYLVTAIDAIRNVGNFAAHPSKDTNTSEIIEVEPGEAEWLIESLEALFDFAFVQPKRLELKRHRLNDKLKAAGKPPVKGSD